MLAHVCVCANVCVSLGVCVHAWLICEQERVYVHVSACISVCVMCEDTLELKEPRLDLRGGHFGRPTVVRRASEEGRQQEVPTPISGDTGWPLRSHRGHCWHRNRDHSHGHELHRSPQQAMME